MKDTNERSGLSTHAAYSERQVMLYPAIWEDPNPETMEDMKISIVNDRATGLKRQRDETTADSPCSKKLCSVVFSCSTTSSTSVPSCSTPSTSKSKYVKQSHVSTPSHTLEQTPELIDEWDDSLLEPLDNEDDSPLYLTVDEMESLLEDDCCYAAEPSGFDKCNATCFSTSESEDEKEKLCSSPCNQLNVSNPLSAATLCEEDLNNYATMAPSPSHLVKYYLEVQVSKHKSSVVGNVKSSDSVQETNGMSTSAVPEQDKTEALTHHIASDCTSNLPVQSPTSLYTTDDVLEWNDDPELSFDGDIDDLLAISSGSDTSSEEKTAAEPSVQCTDQFRSAVSDSTSTYKYSYSVPVDSAGSDTVDVVQQLFPSTSDALKIHSPPSTVSEPPKDSGSPSSSTVVISETQSNIESVKYVKPSTFTDSDAQSTVGLTNQPVDSSAAQISSSHKTNAAPVKKSSVASQERSSVAVTPFPKAPNRLSQFSSVVLESDKDNYCNQVLMHIEDPQGANNAKDPLHELASLLNQISKDNQNWQHPSNFSRRNHPRHGQKPSNHYTLNEWVEKNGGSVQRFINMPSTFQRSPVPGVLPVEFS